MGWYSLEAADVIFEGSPEFTPTAGLAGKDYGEGDLCSALTDALVEV